MINLLFIFLDVEYDEILTELISKLIKLVKLQTNFKSNKFFIDLWFFR